MSFGQGEAQFFGNYKWKEYQSHLPSMHAFLLLVLAAAAPSRAHEIFWGSCPSVKPVADFDMERFSGLWYVIEKFDNGESCVTWNISKGSDANTWVLLERKSSSRMSASTRTTSTLPPSHSIPVALGSWTSAGGSVSTGDCAVVLLSVVVY
ncbi:uncharacterized protein LOC122255772 [Penaeus japonicus]|uniref:uncharacterized protein LOC122255772 n=1 Tax=Penaeus japonicus TaxID=27405 RepID=UPI001C70EED8|nr:uncharacterized protein LOC122255772 [Penaeus japonicus]